MAFTTGVHIECGYGGSRSNISLSQTANFPVEGELIWSQTMTSPGTSSTAAPAPNSTQGDPMISVEAADADVFVSIGPTPNATSGPRMLVRAGTSRQRYVKQGDYVAWVAA